MSGAGAREGGRPAVFLDRDGTIVEEVDYLTEPAQLALIPGAAEALRRDDTQGFVEAAARAPGYQPLVQVAHDYAVSGVTTLDEVLKLAGESRDELLEEPELELELEPEA